jgi:hypothetical protein
MDTTQLFKVAFNSSDYFPQCHQVKKKVRIASSFGFLSNGGTFRERSLLPSPSLASAKAKPEAIRETFTRYLFRIP